MEKAEASGQSDPQLKLTGLDKDETKLQELLKKYAKGELTHQGLCQAEYWDAFASGLHISHPEPAAAGKPVRCYYRMPSMCHAQLCSSYVAARALCC
jgi:hypothetical protein